MSKPTTMKIDEVEYVRKDSIQSEVINYSGEETLASTMIGKKVIVRSYNEGINAGIVVLADETGVILRDCRRLYYHKPKNKSMSWYEGVALSGISSDSKISCTVPKKVIIESYSMTELTQESYNSIMELEPNAQS